MAAKSATAPRKPARRNRAQLRASAIDSIVDETWTPGNKHARLAYSEIETAYRVDPMVFNAVNKKASDLTKKWFYFEHVDERKNDPPQDVVKRLDAFIRRTRLHKQLPAIVRHTLLYGDGYFELVYEGDAANGDAKPTGTRIASLPLVNPSTIRRVRDTTLGSRTNGETKYYEQDINGQRIRIHRERILPLQFYTLGDDDRGLGGVEAAFINIRSKVKGDNALGDILAWYAKGFYILLTQDGNAEETEEGYKLLKKSLDKGINIFSGTDRHEFDIKNAPVVNPREFLESFYHNLAAAFGMPKDVLIGASAGAITGSETNLRDYYEALDALLQSAVTPFLEELFAAELGVPVDELPIRIVWNPLYVNEETEAKTRFTEAQAASIAFEDGIITVNEYRARLGLDPVPDGDRYAPDPAATPGFDSPPVMEPDEPEGDEDELRRLAGDTA